MNFKKSNFVMSLLAATMFASFGFFVALVLGLIVYLVFPPFRIDNVFSAAIGTGIALGCFGFYGNIKGDNNE